MTAAIFLLALVPILAAFIGWAETRKDRTIEVEQTTEYDETWTWPPR